MDMTGADSRAWFKAMDHYCYPHFQNACRNKDWKIPFEVELSETPDISVLLEFTFWQKVL